MEEKHEKPENYIELTCTEKQSSSREGNRGWDKQTKVKVTDATEAEMTEKLCIAAKMVVKSKAIFSSPNAMDVIHKLEGTK